jgi:hypothetical protein
VPGQRRPLTTTTRDEDEQAMAKRTLKEGPITVEIIERVVKRNGKEYRYPNTLRYLNPDEKKRKTVPYIFRF